ncbi:MAG: hypothetical protein PHT78_13865 [Desulfitobacteriaceae bacterium]|nr:hypothetical protein [Desulfitobacteriaceae bacterium]
MRHTFFNSSGFVFSSSDYLAPYDFDTALVYARWHQVLENPKESLLDQYTITYVSSTFPRAMVKRLKERNLVLKESLPAPGIYRVEGEMYPIQMVVINELDDPNTLWPFAAYLTGKNKGKKKAFVQLAAEQIKDPANQDARDLMQFSVKNNLITAEELREVLEMGKQLTAKEKERFFEVLNNSPVTLEWKLKAEAKGKVEGKIEGKIKKSQEAICIYLNVRFGKDSLELRIDPLLLDKSS